MEQSKHITGVKGVTAQPVTEPRINNLAIRILSALVMIPPVLVVTYLGFPYFNVLIAVAVVVMAWEWGRMIDGARFGYEGFILVAGLLAVVFAASRDAYIQALFGLGFIGVVFFFIIAARRLKSRASLHSREMDLILNPMRSLWMAVGALYIGVPAIALIWIRVDWDNGLLAVIWLLVLVWASDSGAYAAGRLIGGPKMAPKISPNKTWAGLGGCVVSAAIFGLIVTQLAGLGGFIKPLAVSALVGLVSQGGDLVESGIKRHFGVKDSSNLIPGHGGVLDRVDGLLAAITAAALIDLASEGTLMS